MIVEKKTNFILFLLAETGDLLGPDSVYIQARKKKKERMKDRERDKDMG